MKGRLKRILILFLSNSGIPFIVRFLIQRRRVTIIYYHNISADYFDHHINYLKRKYTIISLQDYLSGKSNHIHYRLIITFDDGHVNNYKLLEVIKKHNIKVTIFLTSGLINTKRHFWFLLDGLSEMEKSKLKRCEDGVRIEQLKVQFNFFDTKEFDTRQALDLEEIFGMMKFVDFQSHSISHPCLPMCPDEKSKFEIKESKLQLENLLSQPINAIAFPNGDYTDRELTYCQESGYSCALTANHGFNSGLSEFNVLKRISTNDTGNVHELYLRVTCIWYWLKYIGRFKNIN